MTLTKVRVVIRVTTRVPVRRWVIETRFGVRGRIRSWNSKFNPAGHSCPASMVLILSEKESDIWWAILSPPTKLHDFLFIHQCSQMRCW